MTKIIVFFPSYAKEMIQKAMRAIEEYSIYDIVASSRHEDEALQSYLTMC